jgi:hypothetical protein
MLDRAALSCVSQRVDHATVISRDPRGLTGVHPKT